MNVLEASMPKDFASFFGYKTPTAKQNIAFTQDFYNGIPFRYVQLPNKDNGIAYALVNKFLVITSSRDAFRAIVDRLLTP